LWTSMYETALITSLLQDGLQRIRSAGQVEDDFNLLLFFILFYLNK